MGYSLKVCNLQVFYEELQGFYEDLQGFYEDLQGFLWVHLEP